MSEYVTWFPWFGVAGLVIAAVIYVLVKKMPEGNEKMKDIADMIHQGSMSFLKTEYKILRPNLLIPTLRILTENKDNEYPQNIFEIGKVFSLDKKEETRIREQTNLIIALSPGNFTEAKQHLDYLFKTLNLSYSLKENSHIALIEGRTGSILLSNRNNKPIGYIGEVHPNTLHNWNLKMPLSVIELNLDEVFGELI